MNINSDNYYGDNRITTALLLAAGTGSRLFPLTKSFPKCLTLVNKRSILERLVNNLKNQGFKRLVVVTGYKDECIMDFLGSNSGDLSIEYIHSTLYLTTNNIYSLWMARNLINEPFVLFESDLVFDVSQLDDMVLPDRAAIAPMAPWMNGTTISINQTQQINRFHYDNAAHLNKGRYKTVNIYSFSLATWHAIIERLNQYIAAKKVNCYYETVFGEMVADGNLSLQAVLFDNTLWYEIDTIEDLTEAKKIFPAKIINVAIPENALV